MTIINATTARNNFFKLMEEAITTNEPITGKSINPFEEYPPYEKLIGDLKGAYSRRINHQHRFVY